MKSMNMSRVWMIVLCSLVCMAVVYAANPFSFDEDGNLIITEETEVALGERTVNLVGFDSGGFIEKNSASGSVIGNDDGLSFDFFFIHEGVSTVSYEEGTGFTYHYEGKGDITIETGSIDGNGISVSYTHLRAHET